MRIHRHIFGSYRGYTTLARSPGVTPDDCSVLESAIYHFGQTYDPAFPARLASHPTFFTCNLPDSRRAMVRVLQGAADDQRRPTLLFAAAILSRHDWDHALHADIARLVHLRDLWTWNGHRDLPEARLPDTPHPAKISRRRLPNVLQLLTELEFAPPNQSVIVSETEFSAEDIRSLEMLLPAAARDHLTTACRVLSPSMPCSLLCMAREAPDIQTTYTLAAGRSTSPYAAALQESNILTTGHIPEDLILNYADFAIPKPLTDQPKPTGASQ